MSGMLSEGGTGRACKKESSAKTITLSANKLTETIKSYKRACPDGTHDLDKVFKTDLDAFNRCVNNIECLYNNFLSETGGYLSVEIGARPNSYAQMASSLVEQWKKLI